MSSELFDRIDKTGEKFYSRCIRWNNFIFNNKIILLSFIIVAAIFFAAILILNIKTPIALDDYIYEKGIPEGDLLSRLKSIVDYQYNHYFTWGGRMVVHVIAQILLIMDPLVADVVNSFGYLIYAFLIYYLIKGKGKHNLLLFILINLLIWLVQPEIGETMLWITGSANYLWGTSIILAFLLPFRYYEGATPKYPYLKTLGMFLFGIVAGWTNENTALAAVGVVILNMFYFRYNNWKIPVWAILALAGLAIGYVFMIAAPGNYVRAEHINIGDSLTVGDLIKRFAVNTLYIVKVTGLVNLIGIILLIFYLKEANDKEERKNILFMYMTFLLAMMASVYSMVVSPIFPTRSWFGPVTFNIIAVGFLFYKMNNCGMAFRLSRLVLIGFSFIVFGYTYSEGYQDVSEVEALWKKRHADIVAIQKTKEVYVIEFTACKTKFGLSDDPFTTNSLEGYYNIKAKWATE